MLILAVDTSSRVGSVAVLRRDEVIGVVSTFSAENFSSRFFRQFEFLLRELSLGLEVFDLFAVAGGPGSFTGLRVGLTAIKGWAEVYRKPIAAVSTLDAIAAQSQHRVRYVAPVLTASRGQIYCSLYRHPDESNLPGAVRGGQDQVMAPEEFLEYVEKQTAGDEVAIVTPTPDVFSGSLEWFNERKGRFILARVSPILAPFVGEHGYRSALTGQLADPLTLDANYVRRSDAELNWKNPSA